MNLLQVANWQDTVSAGVSNSIIAFKQPRPPCMLEVCTRLKGGAGARARELARTRYTSYAHAQYVAVVTLPRHSPCYVCVTAVTLSPHKIQKFS